MARVEVTWELRSDPRLLELARLTGVADPDLCRAKLENLWMWAAKYRQDGNLESMPVQAVAEASGWRGNPDRWFRALLAAGWLEDRPTRLAGWGDRVQRRVESNRIRQKRWRERDRNALVTRYVTRYGDDGAKSEEALEVLPPSVPLTLPLTLPLTVLGSDQEHGEISTTRARTHVAEPVSLEEQVRLAVSPYTQRLKTGDRVLEAFWRTKRVVESFREDWEKSFGKVANIELKDVKTAAELVMKHDVEEVLRVLHHYCRHFSGWWSKKGSPLRGLASSWQEVQVDRAESEADPETKRRLVECGCAAWKS